MREIRDLDEQLDHEQKKDMAANLERITKDYKQIRTENKELASKLKAAS